MQQESSASGRLSSLLWLVVDSATSRRRDRSSASHFSQAEVGSFAFRLIFVNALLFRVLLPGTPVTIGEIVAIGNLCERCFVVTHEYFGDALLLITSVFGGLRRYYPVVPRSRELGTGSRGILASVGESSSTPEARAWS